jgi:hypothetical protein
MAEKLDSHVSGISGVDHGVLEVVHKKMSPTHCRFRFFPIHRLRSPKAEKASPYTFLDSV